MTDLQSDIPELEEICQQQYDEIEKKKMLVWDLEEENRLLNVRTAQLETKLDEKQNRIDDLERWCAHLQGIIDANAEKEAQHRTQMERIKKRLGILCPIAQSVKRWLCR